MPHATIVCISEASCAAAQRLCVTPCHPSTTSVVGQLRTKLMACQVPIFGLLLLHLQYSYAAPFGPALLVTQDPEQKFTPLTS